MMKLVVAYIKVLTGHSSGNIEENHEKQPAKPLTWTRLDAATS
jgi:hypothetical protein